MRHSERAFGANGAQVKKPVSQLGHAASGNTGSFGSAALRSG